MELLPINAFTVMVPPGTYVLGDPAYTVINDDWHALLRSCNYFNLPIGDVKGRKILGFSTMCGDGIYTDNKEFEYPVDAGLIGLVPYDFANKSQRDRSHLVNIVKFRQPTLCTRDKNGVLTFGHITINTAHKE